MKLAALLFASIAYAQPTQLSLTAPPPSAVTGASGSITGLFGQTPLYYWIIPRYGAGAALPFGPVVVNNTVGAANLSASNYVTISWAGASGATGYDVIRGNTPAYPASPSCASCAVVVNGSSTFFTDQGAATYAYPNGAPGPASSTSVTFSINNRDLSQPFVSLVTNYGGNVAVSALTQYVTSAPSGSCSSAVFPRQYVAGVGTTYGCVAGAWTVIAGPAGTFPVTCAGLPALTGGITTTAGSCATSITNMLTANIIPVVSSAGILEQSTLKLNGGILYPSADSTTAIQVNKADGTTNVVTVDTTNSYMYAKYTSGSIYGVRIGGSAEELYIRNGNLRIIHSGAASSINNATGSSGINIASTGGGPITLTQNAGASVGIGPSNTSPTGTLHVYDATASTGVTTLTLQKGAGQAGNNVMEIKTSGGSLLTRFDENGYMGVAPSSNTGTVVSNGTVASGSATVIGFTSGVPTATFDTGLSRISAGIVGVGTGAASSVAGTVQATTFKSAGTASITWGTGSPESAVTATIGSLFLRTDGGAGTTLYVKESGSGNTGWVAK